MADSRANHGYSASPEELRLIRTKPRTTATGKSFDWFVNEKAASGDWRLECVPGQVLGLSRPLEIYRTVRKTNLVKPWPRSDSAEAYCPAHWADLAVGRGACGLRCRACFLIMTHRLFCDPSRHVVYENVGDYEEAVRRWLAKPTRKNLGLGIDCSDSLLYEGVTGHARCLIPLFAGARTNPHKSKLILLTKSTNVRYLQGLPTDTILLTFSLNPEAIADLWEGKFEDGVRVTPRVNERLKASLRGQDMGFRVRWRIDPILPVDEWQATYSQFFNLAAEAGHRPERITLGTYRETQRTLTTFASGWGLPPMEWKPTGLEKDGDHYHIPLERRIGIYAFLRTAIQDAWGGTGRIPVIALCKEPRLVRREVGLDHDMCNCE
ncbi:MAG: hypothetical protein FJ279_12305 [Planctomycetes bacterium]|nr:hypothetical protein [Planctomycetota bacterium]